LPYSIRTQVARGRREEAVGNRALDRPSPSKVLSLSITCDPAVHVQRSALDCILLIHPRPDPCSVKCLQHLFRTIFALSTWCPKHLDPDCPPTPNVSQEIFKAQNLKKIPWFKTSNRNSIRSFKHKLHAIRCHHRSRSNNWSIQSLLLNYQIPSSCRPQNNRRSTHSKHRMGSSICPSWFKRSNAQLQSSNRRRSVSFKPVHLSNWYLPVRLSTKFILCPWTYT